MTTFRKDTSFPFLAFAQREGYDYSMILQELEKINNQELGRSILTFSQLVELNTLQSDEYNRRQYVAREEK